MEQGVRRSQRDYSLAFKLSVVEQVEKVEMTYKQAQKRYGIQGRSTVLVWCRKHGLQDWTEATFGFGARPIAVFNAATAAPFAELGMIPLLSLIAFYATPGHRATWFALMASLMNMALVGGQLQTKYLNQLFVVSRGDYAELGMLLIASTVLTLVIPLAAIAVFGRRV